jgi:hypothetical protein
MLGTLNLMWMNIAHCLREGVWWYIRCYKRGNDWVDYYTGEVIDRRLIYNIEKL